MWDALLVKKETCENFAMPSHCHGCTQLSNVGGYVFFLFFTSRWWDMASIGTLVRYYKTKAQYMKIKY